jgi:hypothetical protein
VIDEGIRVGGEACDTINDVEDHVDASDLRVLTLGGICRLELSPSLFTITASPSTMDDNINIHLDATSSILPHLKAHIPQRCTWWRLPTI